MTNFASLETPIANKQGRVVFLGFLGFAEEIEIAFVAESAPQWSAINFQKALLGALADADVDTYVVGTLPVASYPRNRPYFSGRRGPAGETTPLLNLPGVRMFWRACISLWRLLSVVHRDDAILVYALYTPLLVAAIVAARMKRVRVGIVIPDLPMFMNSGNGGALRGFLKSLDNHFLRWLTRQADVAFPITAEIARDWLGRSDRFVVIEGVSPSQMEPVDVARAPAQPQLLYAGSFSHIYKCVEMFRSSTVEAELVLIGDGPERASLENLASRDARIVVKKFMHPDQLRLEVQAASFLLNLRDTKWAGGKYSFPSKLIEYIRLGKPVISTRLDGIPAEYFEYFFELDDSSYEGFAGSLAQAVATGPDQLAAIVGGAQAMLRERKSSEAVGRRIIGALRGA